MSCSSPPFHDPPPMDHFDINMEAPKSASFGAMGSLLRKLDELVHTEVDGARGLRDDLGSISTKLAKLSEVYDPSLTMNYWMKDVRELSYDMEDCVDQFIYSLGPGAKMACINNLLGFRSRLEEVRERYDRYNLEYGLKHSTTTIRHRFPTVYREPTPVFPGMERLINQFQIEPKSDDENNVQLKVVSILGVEGVGKSTLAQKLWHELGGQFEYKAFVQTAKQPDMRIILKNILSQIRPQQMPEACQLVPNLILDIRKHLQDKRYFIIIDDLWAVSVWDVFSRCFPEGNHCSRIITTTTIYDVALASCSYDPEHIFPLEPLGADHSYQLFISRVFGSGKGCPQQFSEVSADITKKCGGLPLAIICIATLVASQPETIEHWEFVRSILHHNLRTNSSFPEILKLVLKLCYSALPHCLKTCLLYLSAYPENYVFMRDDLVKQWIAEDFICTMDGMDLVEVASRYFDELLSLGLIQRMDTNSKKKGLSYVVHPTVFDFIMCKSMEDNFITVVDYSQSTVVLTDKIRRLSLHFGSATYATQPASIDVSQVRSVIFIGLLNCMPSLAEFRLVQILILHLRSDDGATMFSLAEICELLLLRYLQVRCNVVVQLPQHIQYLKHLEMLEINARVAAIPSDIVHVRKLSNLCLGERKNFKHLTLSHVASGKAVSLDDSSSESTPRLQILEFLPPICFFSRLPVWIYELRRLYILEIVVKELSTKDISSLGELPALTALSLYLRIPMAGPVVFRRGMFPVLEYFKFVSGVLLLDFREEAMPNLRRLKLGFNAHKGEQYGDMLAGIQHLLNLQKIVASIGAATDAEEFDRRAAWSAFNDAIRMHPCQKSSKVKSVDRIDEEYDPSKKQSWSQESVSERDDVPKEPCVTQNEGLSTEQLLIMSAEYTEKHADISEYIECDKERETVQYIRNSAETKEIVDYGNYTIDKREIQCLLDPEAYLNSEKKQETRMAMDLVSGTVGSLISKLGELLNEEYKLQKGVTEKIGSLIKDLECAYVALKKVAEVPPDQLEEQVKTWAREVREASYDMEDVLDTFLVEDVLDTFLVSAQGDPEQTGHQSLLEHLMKKMADVYDKVVSGPLKRRKIAITIDDINKRLQEVTERHRRYTVDSFVSKPSPTLIVDPRLAAMYKQSTDLVGIEKPRDELISMLSPLVGDVESKNKMMKMVSVLGVGGLGKTILAKTVYDKLKGDFQCTAFVPIGRNPDLKKVFRDLLIEFDKNKYMDPKMSLLDERQLIDELREYLRNKRYFIVIDDIWETKYWETIKLALVQDNCGSRLITTTRKLEVATECGEVYRLQPLGYDESKKLFHTRIFGAEGKYLDTQLDAAFDKMIKKCDGVPLAIITMASLLVGKSREEWMEVCRSIVFRDKKNQQVDDTEWILSLSYYDLPAHLKTCLLYLSAFPEDYVIDKDSLIWKWVAEGFVHNKEPGTSLFEVGEGYFYELVNRSMIQAVKSEMDISEIVYGCRLHDMVLDLLRLKSQEQNFITISRNIIAEGSSQPSSRVRRLVHQNKTIEQTHQDSTEMDMLHVRTFIACRCDVIDKVLSFRSFKLLRVLALEDCNVVHLDHVDNLHHLRYLSLKGIGNFELPTRIGSLKFLQTLECSFGLRVEELPSSLGLLTQLICLRAGYAKVPNGVIKKLTSLEQLQISCSNDMVGQFVKDLGKLRELRVLHCNFLSNLLDKSMLSDLVESLGYLNKIQNLALYGCWNTFQEEIAFWNRAVLPRPLRRLFIKAILFTALPSCINPLDLPNLTHLYLSVRDLDEQGLKILGALPELHHLELRIWSTTTITIHVADGCFHKLRSCSLYDSVTMFVLNKDSSVSFTIGTNGSRDDVAFDSKKGDECVAAPAVMPNLRGLLFVVVNVKDIVLSNLGLEYLPSLQRVKVEFCISCHEERWDRMDDVQRKYYVQREREIDALRHAIETHPNRPTVEIGYSYLTKSRPVADEDVTEKEEATQC